jgi:hypothetical protein
VQDGPQGLSGTHLFDEESSQQSHASAFDVVAAQTDWGVPDARSRIAMSTEMNILARAITPEQLHL